MKNKALKWAILGGALAVIVMYGMDMSSAGIERIYGPIEGGSEYIEPVLSEEAAAEPVSEIAMTQQQKIAQLEKELAEVKRLASLTDEEYQLEAVGESLNENERLPGVPLETDQPAVNKLADSTSGLLQTMSSEGIRFVASFFDGLTK